MAIKPYQEGSIRRSLAEQDYATHPFSAVALAADTPSGKPINRRRTTTSYLPDDTGTMVSTYGSSVCYLRYGIIKQWGEYDGHPSSISAESPTIIDPTVFNGATPVKVASGWYQQCALLDDGRFHAGGYMVFMVPWEMVSPTRGKPHSLFELK